MHLRQYSTSTVPYNVYTALYCTGTVQVLYGVEANHGVVAVQEKRKNVIIRKEPPQIRKSSAYDFQSGAIHSLLDFHQQRFHVSVS